MKKLLNTLFITSETAYLSLQNENVIVSIDQNEIARFPLHLLENIFCFSYSGASPALMGYCAEKKIGLTFMTPQGRFLARSCGKSSGNVLLRKEQYRISDDMSRGIMYARNFVFGKVYNSKYVLSRMVRDHAERIDKEVFRQAGETLSGALIKIREAKDPDILRGIEGNSSSLYFSLFDQMILRQKEEFYFNERTRRPPTDNVNALLSFLYTILSNECANALECVGLDAAVGFMHRDRPGRASLALDLVEEFRAVLADRLALTMINNQEIQTKHFETLDGGGTYLTTDGRKIVINAWQQKKKEKIKHPYLEETIEWGLVPYVQALLLARTIRGDIEEYPAFLWK